MAPTRCDSPDRVFTADSEAHPVALSDGRLTIADAHEPSLRPEGNECLQRRQREAAAAAQCSTHTIIVDARAQGAIVRSLNTEMRQQIAHKHEALASKAGCEVLSPLTQHRVVCAPQRYILAALVWRVLWLARSWVEAERPTADRRFCFGKTVFLLTNNLHGRTRRRRGKHQGRGEGLRAQPRAARVQHTRAQAET